MSDADKPFGLACNDGLGAGAEARCICNDRALSACPGEWEPGCDLGNNPAHVRAYQECAANGSGPCRIGPHGPKGEPQCEWCGEAPND